MNKIFYSLILMISNLIILCQCQCQRSDGSKGICKPNNYCKDDLEASKCDFNSVFVGLCCKSVFNLENSQEYESREIFENAFKVAIENVLMADQHNLPLTTRNSPLGYHSLFNQHKIGTTKVAKFSKELIFLSNEIQTMKQIEDVEDLSVFNAKTVDLIREHCPWNPVPICSYTQKYRKADGTCGNLSHGNYGRSITPFQRLISASYTDAFSHPRALMVNGDPLPSSRVLSTSIITTNSQKDISNSLLLMQFGQFVDHDLAHSPFLNISCCEEDNSFPEIFDSDMCYPIKVENNDLFWKGRKSCISLTRSATSPDLHCELGPKQQMNQVTHWLDNSNIYGSFEEDADFLKGNLGKLKTSLIVESHHNGLPSCSNVTISNESCNSCQTENKKYCFFAGDSRVNEQPNLAVMHTIWLREHNRIAEQLQSMNSHWSSETIYQESRRITNAEYMHIIYNEWLPIIIGKNEMKKRNLFSRSFGYMKNDGFDKDPRISNVFATAAFRFGHTLVPEELVSYVKGELPRKTQLRDSFLNPSQLSEPKILEGYIKGLMNQNMEKVDGNFVADLRDHLFEVFKNEGGLDLIAINIQRGREHGLPGYTKYLEYCGLKVPTDFENLYFMMEKTKVDEMKTHYYSIEDIDVFVGGILEKPSDGILGPLFSCLIADQFERLKYGDRFFYENNDDVSGFSEKQLNEIRKVTIARILCDNSDVNLIQKQAFYSQNYDNNGLYNCNSFGHIPKVNLMVFQDKTTVSSTPNSFYSQKFDCECLEACEKKIEIPECSILQ